MIILKAFGSILALASTYDVITFGPFKKKKKKHKKKGCYIWYTFSVLYDFDLIPLFAGKQCRSSRKGIGDSRSKFINSCCINTPKQR